MSMNNIVICLLCLLIIPKIVSAEGNLALACKDFRADINETAEPTPQIPPTPFDTGLLWRVETPEGKTNYLFGTIHSQNPEVSAVPPLVRGAILQSKRLIMETVPNQAANNTFMQLMNFKDGRQLNQLLEKDFFDELTRQIQSYGLEKEQVKFIKPWAAFSIIGRPKPINAPTLESNLYQIARKSRLDIQSLESMEEILSALDNLSIEDQLIILKDTVCNHQQILKDTEELIKLYLNSDLAGITAFNQQTHYDEGVFDRFMQSILYDRNNRMLKRIEKTFKEGNTFVAIGASHLAGEKGLLMGLSEKLYKIHAIY